jgi:hypothetical protein
VRDRWEAGGHKILCPAQSLHLSNCSVLTGNSCGAKRRISLKYHK